MDSQVATRSLIRIRGSASIREAARLMCDMSMGALGVDDANHEFLGLVTERDLIWAVAQGRALDAPVEDIVNDFPIVVDGPLTVESAARRMIAGHVRHLVVREPQDLGIVSMRDLLPSLLGARDPAAPARVASTSELRRMFGTSLAGGKKDLR